MTHTRSTFRRTLAALLLAAAAAVPAALPARAQAVPSDAVMRGFQRTGDYVLLVNGQEDKGAEIYQNDKIPAYLILPTALPSPVLLTPRAGSVETVNLMKVAKQKDGTVDLLADAVLAPQGKFQILGEKVAFTSEGKAASLSPNPPLLGLKKNAELKAHNPVYARTAQSYTPNPAAIAALKEEAQPVTVRVFFGSWCPHCRQHVPLLLKVEDQLGASKIHFEYYGLPRDFKDPEAKRMKITGVPTAVVYVNGRETGRMQTNDWAAPEVSLSRVLGIAPQGAAKLPQPAGAPRGRVSVTPVARPVTRTPPAG
jgi:thiol-disulfide isomerase/thioredoxin